MANDRIRLRDLLPPKLVREAGLMKASVYFYKNISPDSVLYKRMLALKSEYATGYWIGSVAGFGANQLSWPEAIKLATRIAVEVYKSESMSVFEEMRIMVQSDA